MTEKTLRKWCLIRADASTQIGSGHIMRCMALAKAMQQTGLSCVFVARYIPESLKQMISHQGHTLIQLSKDNLPSPRPEQGEYGIWLGTSEQTDAQSVLKAISKTVQLWGDPTLIMCDHYGLGEAWEGAIRKSFSAPIFVIDDLSNRAHQCQSLLDTTFGKTAKSYNTLVPSDCQLLVGADYALLRPEFAKAREEALSRRDKNFADKRPLENLVISMGGMDKDNVSLKMIQAVEALSPLPKFKVEVLVGKDCVHLPMLRDYAAQSSLNIIVHGGINNVADLYARADLCIGAAGSSTWERCCLGLPTINVTIAENQETIARNLSQEGLVKNGGNFQEIVPEDFANNILRPLIASNTSCESLSLSSRKICDGFGVDRVMLALNSRSVKDGKVVTLRMAHNGDIRRVYDWQTLPETRQYANNPKSPEWEQHLAWMTEKLIRTKDYFYIIQCDGKEAGVLRLDLDMKEEKTKKHVVSIFIDPVYFGYGVASAALSLLSDTHSDKDIWAQVHADNMASISLFTRAGYIRNYADWYLLARNLD